MGKVPYVNHQQVATWLLKEQDQQTTVIPNNRLRVLHLREKVTRTLVVDVRDIDFGGGNVRNAVNMPYFDEASALQLMLNCETHSYTQVVFHCLYSRYRGPKAAQIFTKFQEKYNATQKTNKRRVVEVHVLEGGWSKWKKHYKQEERLVENMDESKVVITPDDRSFIDEKSL